MYEVRKAYFLDDDSYCSLDLISFDSSNACEIRQRTFDCDERVNTVCLRAVANQLVHHIWFLVVLIDVRAIKVYNSS